MAKLQYERDSQPYSSATPRLCQSAAGAYRSLGRSLLFRGSFLDPAYIFVQAKEGKLQWLT